MVTVGILGGLGNQLFQYAFGRYLSIKKNTGLALDYYQQIIRSDFDAENLTKITDIFDLPVKLYIGKTRKRILNRPGLTYLDRLITKACLMDELIIKENNYNKLEKNIKNGKNIYLIGYWHSEQYFADLRDTIRNDFKFKIERHASDLNIYREITDSNSVGLHIRGNDHLITPIYSRGCDVGYYSKAINIISRSNSDLKTFIFTDDIEHVQLNYKELLKISEIVNVDAGFNSEAIHLLLMSKCKHNVIANSSFGWWGAWLNSNPDKIIVAPKKWFVDSNYYKHNIVPSVWKKI